MSGSAPVTIAPADPKPVFEQVRDQLAERIRRGGLARGERLPSIRALATDLGIAPGTVAKAYAELEAAGLVRTARGAGTVVDVSAEHEPAVLAAARELVTAARAADVSRDQALLAVRAAWDSSEPGVSEPA